MAQDLDTLGQSDPGSEELQAGAEGGDQNQAMSAPNAGSAPSAPSAGPA